MRIRLASFHERSFFVWPVQFVKYATQAVIIATTAITATARAIQAATLAMNATCVTTAIALATLLVIGAMNATTVITAITHVIIVIIVNIATVAIIATVLAILLVILAMNATGVLATDRKRGIKIMKKYNGDILEKTHASCSDCGGDSYSISAITINMTETCNLGCPYCFANQKGKKLRTITWDVLKDAIDWLIVKSGDSKRISITWFGGEPTITWGLVKKGTLYAEEQAKKHNKEAKFSMTTNGYDIPDDFEEFIFANGRKFGVLLSMDGLPESQNHNRPSKTGNKESFTQVNNTLDRLLKIEKWKNSGTQIRLTFNKATIGQLYDNLKFFYDEKGVNSVAPMPVEEETWSREDLDRARVEFEKIGDFYIQRHREGKPFYIKIFNDVIERQISPVTRKNKRSLVTCGYSVNQVAMDPAGNLSSCHRLIDYDRNIGRYKQGSIYDKDDSQLRKIRDEFANITIDEIKCVDESKCVFCPIKLECGGGCSAVNIEVCGDPRIRPEVSCDMRILWYQVACKIDSVLGPSGEKNKHYMEKYYTPRQNRQRPDRRDQNRNQGNPDLEKILINLHNKMDRFLLVSEGISNQSQQISEVLIALSKAFLEKSGGESDV